MVFESPRWLFNSFLVLVSTILYSIFAHELFNALPRIDDSVAAVYQARVFAEGHLLWPMPADIQKWFDIFGVLTPDDKPDYRAGMYPPGWSMLLVPGVLLGKTWLINPILAGFMLVAVSELGDELFNRVTGRVAALLGFCSPFVSAVAASQLSHISAALFVTLAWWLALRLLRTGRTHYAVLGGLSLGFTLLIRPETAVLVGGIFVLGILIQYRRALEIWKGLAVALSICVLSGISLLVWQDVTVGSPGKVGHSLEMLGGEKLGFGKVPQSSYVYTPAKAVDHSIRRLDMLNKNLLGWPVPAMLLVLAPFFLWRFKAYDVWLLGPLLVLAGFYAFYWYFEYWLHARYLFPAVPALLILAARGGHAWQYRLSQISIPESLGRLSLTAALVYALVIGGPQYFNFFQENHGDVEDVLMEVVEAAELENALVFYNSSGKLRGVGRWNDYYATGAYYNSLNLDGDIVFARDGWLKRIKRRNGELISLFPNRNYYLYDFNQLHMSARLYKLDVRDGYIVSRDLIALHSGRTYRAYPGQDEPHRVLPGTYSFEHRISQPGRINR